MINELFRINDSLKSWGIDLADISQVEDFFPLKKNSQCKQAIAAVFAKDGSFTFELLNGSGNNGYCEKYHYESGRKPWGLSFKLSTGIGSKETSPSKLQNHFDNTCEFVAGLGIQCLDILAANIRAVNVDEFTTEVLKFAKAHKDTQNGTYVSFDIEGNPVQSMRCFREIHRKYCDLQGSQTKDAYGLTGNPPPTLKSKAKYDFYLFSRNIQNDLYRRFGLNGHDAFPIGEETYHLAQRIYQSVLGADKEIKYKNKEPGTGIWFEFRQRFGSKKSKSKKNISKFLVLSSLMPNDNSFQANDFGVMEAQDWEEKVQQTIDAIHAQTQANPETFGYIVILEDLGTGRNVTRSSSVFKTAEVGNFLAKWRDGINNGSTYVPGGKFNVPNLIMFLNTVNSSYIVKKGVAQTCFNPGMGLQEAYNFFFEKSDAVKLAARAFAENGVPLLLQLKSLDKIPFEAIYLVPIRNLLLHKLGIYKEHFMDHWAYTLGRIFRAADSFHAAYFVRGGKKQPPELIGSNYVSLALKNPAKAWGSFIERFEVYRKWAENEFRKPKWTSDEKGAKSGKFSWSDYADNVVALSKLVLTNGLPQRCTPQDKLLLSAAFLEFIPKSNGTEPEKEVVVEKE